MKNMNDALELAKINLLHLQLEIDHTKKLFEDIRSYYKHQSEETDSSSSNLIGCFRSIVDELDQLKYSLDELEEYERNLGDSQ